MEKSEKVMGIIGGMGPEATLDLFARILERTPVQKDQDHLKIIIYNNPKIPDRTEAIVKGGVSPLPAILETAEALKAAGAEFLIMPCNTAHFYYDELAAGINLPVINMVAETAKRVKETSPGKAKVGLLSTLGTIKSRIYHEAFSREGIEVMVPGEREQQEVMAMILAVKAGNKREEHFRALAGIMKTLIARGAGGVVLGCTELPLLYRPCGDIRGPVYIPQDILAEKAVQYARAGT